MNLRVCGWEKERSFVSWILLKPVPFQKRIPFWKNPCFHFEYRSNGEESSNEKRVPCTLENVLAIEAGSGAGFSLFIIAPFNWV